MRVCPGLESVMTESCISAPEQETGAGVGAGVTAGVGADVTTGVGAGVGDDVSAGSQIVILSELPKSPSPSYLTPSRITEYDPDP